MSLNHAWEWRTFLDQSFFQSRPKATLLFYLFVCLFVLSWKALNTLKSGQNELLFNHHPVTDKLGPVALY